MKTTESYDCTIMLTFQVRVRNFFGRIFSPGTSSEKDRGDSSDDSKPSSSLDISQPYNTVHRWDFVFLFYFIVILLLDIIKPCYAPFWTCVLARFYCMFLLIYLWRKQSPLAGLFVWFFLQFLNLPKCRFTAVVIRKQFLFMLLINIKKRLPYSLLNKRK